MTLQASCTGRRCGQCQGQKALEQLMMGAEPQLCGPQCMSPNSVWHCVSAQVFSQAKGINFLQNKTLRVRRLYDAKHSTLLYVAYSTRLSNDSKVWPLPEASTATLGQ